ncbi:unnamed protein product [Heterosigma akashiwo]
MTMKKRGVTVSIFFVILYIFGVPWLKSVVEKLNTGVNWVGHSPLSGLLALIFTFMLISMLGVFLFIPGTPPTIAAGWVFGCALGLKKGLPLAILGVWLGDATGSFIVFVV